MYMPPNQMVCGGHSVVTGRMDRPAGFATGKSRLQPTSNVGLEICLLSDNVLLLRKRATSVVTTEQRMHAISVGLAFK